MPLLNLLAAPGSARRSLCRNTRFPKSLAFNCRIQNLRIHAVAAASNHLLQRKCPACRRLCLGAPSLRPWPTVTATSCFRWQPPAHLHPRRHSSHKHLLEGDMDPHMAVLLYNGGDGSEGLVAEASVDVKKGSQITRSAQKLKRKSILAHVLASARDDVRDLYDIPEERHGAVSSRSTWTDPHRSSLPYATDHALSLSSILIRRIHASQAHSAVELSPREASLFALQGYSAEDLRDWLSCIQAPNSGAAAAIFRAGRPTPPLFLVLLFLRRRRIRTSALGIIMRHLDSRRNRSTIPWEPLKTLTVRLLRHARMEWPESIPWIASFFSAEAGRRIVLERKDNPKLIQDMTQFCNTLLWLLSLPSTLHPFRNSTHQENAQFQVLQFMQGCNPPLVVTRTGFRAVVRNQLMHPKTAQEREWAKLKGPSWPPWKEARNAMDEDKGYQFGASRASRILHRMYEAGYDGSMWEQVAEVYAGWDTDLSPTIQTRTTFPFLPSRSRNDRKMQTLLWVARIQATRSHREAWACFLAWEASEAPVAPGPYAAMFWKLSLPEINKTDSGKEDESGSGKRRLLAGDTKEAFSDPESPLNLVHITEPLPRFEQLFNRMKKKDVPISRRLLFILVQSHPHFPSVIGLFKSHGHLFGNGARKFLTGELLSKTDGSLLPEYFFGSLLSFLCRFGSFSRLPPIAPMQAVPHNHARRIETDKHYLLEYAYALLMHVQPRYRPAWTSYMEVLLFNCFVPKQHGRQKTSHVMTQYTIIKTLFDTMDAIELDPDDEQFRLLCTCVRFAAQQALTPGALPKADAQHILSTAPRLLRAVFHTLVAANMDPHEPTYQSSNIPPHIPDPAILHAYVRALGMLRDYEGLYSFSTWATANHAALTARANAQRSGPQALYRTFVVLRAAVEGSLKNGARGAPPELAELVKVQLESVREWGWPLKQHVDLYMRNSLVGGRADAALRRGQRA